MGADIGVIIVLRGPGEVSVVVAANPFTSLTPWPAQGGALK